MRKVKIATTLNQDLSNFYVGLDDELAPFHANSLVALTPRMTCSQAPTPDAFTLPSDKKGHF
jgi:hypothetical protein